MILPKRVLLQALAFLAVQPGDTGRASSDLDSNMCWKTMSESGWTEEDKETARKEFKKEAENKTFVDRVSKRMIVNGTEKKSAALYKFIHPTDLDLTVDQTANKTAVFVLGPSAVGKTSMSATLAAEHPDLGIHFPLITHDGGDWRDASSIWEKYSQAPDGKRTWFPNSEGAGDSKCLLSDFVNEIYKKAADKSHCKLAMDLLKEHKLSTILVPQVAAGCHMPQDPAPSCKAIKLKKELEQLGCTVKFLVIHGDRDTVQRMGEIRSVSEGKRYSKGGYVGAVAAVVNIYRMYPDASFDFYLNSFEDQGPKKISWERYHEIAKPLLEKGQEEVCKKNDKIDEACIDQLKLLSNFDNIRSG